MKAPSHCPHCGCELVKIRSPQDHNRFFAVIARAYECWPESHEHQPSSAEHLRAYLLVSAGYHDVATVDLSWVTQDKNLLTLARLNVEASIAAGLARGDYVFTRPRGDIVEVLRPKSIAWAALGQKEFGPIRQACEEIIENVIGVKADQLLKEKAA